MSLLVYTEKRTPRIDYIFNLMIEDIAGFSFQTTGSKEEFEAYTGPKLAYSNEAFQDAIIVPSAFFLDGNTKEVKELHYIIHDGVDCPFAIEGSSDFRFDIFSAGFYLVTRCEEYSGKSRDHHHRFSIYESIAYKKGFIEKPVVNLWALELRKKILNKFPSLICKTNRFKIVSTIDVDQLYAIKARGMKRTLGRLGKQAIGLNLKNIAETLSVLLFNQKDPFDTFEYILSFNAKTKNELLFFVHLGDYGMYDKSIQWNHKDMKRVIQSLAAQAIVGIHPSYRSNEDLMRLKVEIQRYEELVQASPQKSRQHYLKLSFPETYERLLKEGILADYTMGYSECVGFRASICNPFKFYDLQTESITNLIVYPFAIMDRALKDGMKLSLNESIDKVKKLLTEVKLSEGIFITLFHNESLSENKEWKGWRSVYESIFK